MFWGLTEQLKFAAQSVVPDQAMKPLQGARQGSETVRMTWFFRVNVKSGGCVFCRNAQPQPEAIAVENPVFFSNHDNLSVQW